MPNLNILPRWDRSVTWYHLRDLKIGPCDIVFFASHSAPPNIPCPTLLSIIFSSSYIYCTIVRKIRDVICEVERASCQHLVFFLNKMSSSFSSFSTCCQRGNQMGWSVSYHFVAPHDWESLWHLDMSLISFFLSRTTISGQFLRSFMQTSLAARYFKESPPVLQLGRNRMVVMKMATRTMNR